MTVRRGCASGAEPTSVRGSVYWGPLGQDFTFDTLGSAALLGVRQAGSTGVRGTELESPRAVGE